MEKKGAGSAVRCVERAERSTSRTDPRGAAERGAISAQRSARGGGDERGSGAGGGGGEWGRAGERSRTARAGAEPQRAAPAGAARSAHALAPPGPRCSGRAFGCAGGGRGVGFRGILSEL